MKKSFYFIATFIVIWCLRGYILSGCPLFPSEIGKINCRWTVPENIIQYTQQEIYAYARLNKSAYKTPIFNEYVELNKNNFESELLKNYSWLKTWINYNFFYDGSNGEALENNDLFSELDRIFTSIIYFNTSINFAVQVLLSLAGMIIFVFIKKNNYNKLFLLLWISSFIAIVAWFLTAPAIRFTNGIGIIWLCSTILLFSENIKIKFINKKCKNIVVLLSVLLLIWHFNIYYSADIYKMEPISQIPPRPIRQITTNSGLIINVPVSGAMMNDCQLPSTPLLDMNLHLLGNSIEDGFAISDIH